MIKFMVILFIILFCISKFMEGYNQMDTPSQVRKIARQQSDSESKNRMSELEREKEILQLKKEIEELKRK